MGGNSGTNGGNPPTIGEVTDKGYNLCEIDLIFIDWDFAMLGSV